MINFFRCELISGEVVISSNVYSKKTSPFGIEIMPFQCILLCKPKIINNDGIVIKTNYMYPKHVVYYAEIEVAFVLSLKGADDDASSWTFSLSFFLLNSRGLIVTLLVQLLVL